MLQTNLFVENGKKVLLFCRFLAFLRLSFLQLSYYTKLRNPKFNCERFDYSVDYSLQIIQSNKKLSIQNGMFSMIANSYSGFLSLYAINILNASHQQIGLLNSLPSIISLLTTIIGGYYFSRLQTKKSFCGISIISTRSFLLLFALIPFLPAYQALVLVVLFAVMNVPGSLANLSWQSFIGDLIPERERGQFFSNRNRVLTIVSMLATAFVGLVLNLFDQNNAYPFQILFVMAFFFGVLETIYLFRHVEIKEYGEQNVQTPSIRETIKSMLNEKPFLFFLLSSMLFNFGWQMAWPLFNIYQIEYAGATAFWLSMFTVTNQFSQILTYRWWGRMSQRFGNGVLLSVAAAGMAFAPFLTVLSVNLIYLTLVNLLTGIFLAGTNLLLFNQLLSVSPDKERSAYITQYTIFIGLIGFLAPQFGVFLLGKIGIYTTMNISSVIRLLGSSAFLIVALILYKRLKLKAEE